jgi:apolipoprotein N-acyltransferase
LLLDQSKTAIDDNVDLLVWPETATSGYILQGNDDYLNLILKSLRNSKLISGIPYFSDDGLNRKYFNSAVLIDSDGIKNIYHKIKLVPMGEYVPLSEYFPKLNQLNLGQGNFTRGLEHTIMDVNNVQCATMICFESTLPSLNRDFVNAGAEVLLYVVNDGWYETPPQPQQHSKQVIFRAIENRRPVLRCANTGVSMVVDPIGNKSNELQLNKKGMLQATIMPQNIITFYTRYGDIFAQLNVIVLLLIMMIGFVRKK